MKVVVIDSSCFSLPYDHSLCEGLSRQGCEVLFIGSESRHFQWNLSISYKRWNHFYQFTNQIYKNPSGKMRPYLKGIEHILDMGRLVNRLRKRNPDVIHFQWLPLPGIDRWFLLRLRKQAPLVLTVHNTEPHERGLLSPMQLGFAKALRLFDHYIVHTEFSRDELISNTGIDKAKITVIPHGVLDYYRVLWGRNQSLDALEWASARKTILFFGLIRQYKGLDVLIKAFSLLPQKLRKETKLLVVGEPKMSIEPLQDLATRLGVANRIVWDLRFIPEEEVASVFERAFVVVLPYHRIDQSGVLMTALAFGKPVIAAKVGGFAEILKDGVHGYLIKPGDIEGLAQALERILSQPELAQKMGEAVRNLAGGELSWDTIARRTIQVYETLSQRQSGK